MKLLVNEEEVSFELFNTLTCLWHIIVDEIFSLSYDRCLRLRKGYEAQSVSRCDVQINNRIKLVSLA